MISRIALDGRFFTAHYPGIGRYAYNLSRALPRVCSQAEISVLVAEEDDRFPHAGLAGVELVPVEVPVRSLREQFVVPRLLGGLGARIFHSPYFVTPYRPPCALVVTVHDAIALRSPDYLRSPFARLAFRLASHLAMRSARTVITVSEASKRDLVRFFRAAQSKIVVIPEAAAPELGPAPKQRIDDLRRRRGLPGRFALFVGTAKPHKNLTGLIRAWERLDDPSCTLVVAGRRDARFPEAERETRRRGLDVRFLGEVPEAALPVLYSAAELVVMPSFCEGFGLPVLEAMACGTPVACSGVSSLPEVAGDAAAFFDPRSSESMAGTISHLLRDADRRRGLVERGFARAGQFSWERAAERTFEVYRRILSRS